MRVNLVGVLEDGSKRGPGVPVDPRTPLSIIQGSDVLIRLLVLRSGGARVPLAGSTVVLGLRKKRNGINLRRSGAITAESEEGEIHFFISAAETKLFKPGQYVYDIWLDDGTDRDAVVPYSSLVVEPAVDGVLADGAITDSDFPVVVAPPSSVGDLDTSGVSSGRMVYASDDNTVDHTDAATYPETFALGAFLGLSGAVTFSGPVTLSFSALSPQPVAGDPVFVARADDEAANAAAGKVTTAAPAIGFVSLIGQVIDGDSASFPVSRQALILLYGKPQITKLA